MKAVIFDMDGVIVNSEPLWRQAEKEVFSSLGVTVTEEKCQITKRLTTAEVTQFWFEQNPWEEPAMSEVESMVVDKVIALISITDCIIPGVTALATKLRQVGFNLAIATNSPFRIIPHVLKRAGLTGCFDIVLSSEFEKNGKPSPDVYLSVLDRLGITAPNCVAIEDSNSGLLAAKRAGIRGLAFRNMNLTKQYENSILEIESFESIDTSIFEDLIVS